MKFIKVEVFVPTYNKEKLITALNDNDILKYGFYDRVYSETRLTSHFRPLEGAKPREGKINQTCHMEEIKLEFRIKDSDKEKTLAIIKENHAYEEPVINMIELL
ncbi:MAG: hypothetical protein PUG67_07560 [Peptoniphilaceae bacterium]|nr:hypothetical protein [Peptoniphilaceae bacterium]